MKSKTLLIILYLSTLAGYILAQSPGFSYQAVLRNSEGDAIPNSTINLYVTLLEGPLGTILYQEEHTLSTNEFGLLLASIGGGIPEIGQFSDIKGIENLYIKVQARMAGQPNLIDFGESPVGTIPFALYGEDADADPKNELQQLEMISAGPGGVEIGLSGSDSTLLLPIGPDEDNNPKNEIQDLKETARNDKLVLFTIDSGTTVISADGNANNELQSLVASVDPENDGNWRIKVVPQLKGNPLDPDIFQVVDRDSRNEIQTFNKVIIDEDGSTDRLELIDAKGNVVDFVILLDQNPNNELQKLSKDGTVISLDQEGMSVVLNDDDPNNELQDLSLNNKALSISGGNTISLDELSPWQRDGNTVVTEGKIVADAICLGNERMVFDDGTLSLRYNNGSDGIEISANGGSGPVITFMDQNSNVLGQLRPDGEGGIELTSNSGKASSRSSQNEGKSLELVGSAMLLNGSKTVKFPAQWNLTQINPENIKIIASPQSASSKGLAIVNKTIESFQVKELFDGSGSYPFDYSIQIIPPINQKVTTSIQSQK